MAAKSGFQSKGAPWADVDDVEKESEGANEMNRDTAEFVPSMLAEPLVLSIGAQLDWWISSLCGRVDALEVQNKKLCRETNFS